MVQEEGNRASCLEDAPKLPLFLRFPNRGTADIDNNYMPLVRSIGKFNPRQMMLFHQDILPFIGGALKNFPIKGVTVEDRFICPHGGKDAPGVRAISFFDM